MSKLSLLTEADFLKAQNKSQTVWQEGQMCQTERKSVNFKCLIYLSAKHWQTDGLVKVCEPNMSDRQFLGNLTILRVT